MISGSGMALEQNLTTGGTATGDVLGLTSYFGGLSGGSWATASFYANDGKSPSYLIENVSDGWGGCGQLIVDVISNVVDSVWSGSG